MLPSHQPLGSHEQAGGLAHCRWRTFHSLHGILLAPGLLSAGFRCLPCLGSPEQGSGMDARLRTPAPPKPQPFPSLPLSSPGPPATPPALGRPWGPLVTAFAAPLRAPPCCGHQCAQLAVLAGRLWLWISASLLWAGSGPTVFHRGPGELPTLLLPVPPAAGLSLEWLTGTASLICSQRTPAASLAPPPSLAVIPEGSLVTLSVPFI